jgi:hypothetical protein
MIENNWETTPASTQVTCSQQRLRDRQRAPCDIATIVPIFAGQAGRVRRDHVIDTGGDAGLDVLGQTQRFGDGYDHLPQDRGERCAAARLGAREQRSVRTPVLDPRRAHPHRRLPHDPRPDQDVIEKGLEAYRKFASGNDREVDAA